MRSVTYSMGASLDGYIVGPDGGFDWTPPDAEVLRCAEAAETMRRRWPDLVFILGTELTWFMRGILPGENFMERLGSPFRMWKVKTFGTHNKPLNAFLATANHAVREIFRGAVTYASAHFGHGKPVIITEVGCCTYRGAEDRGAMGWAIVDTSQTPWQLNGDYVRDEGLQARELTDMLRIVDGAGVGGAFVFTFVSPALAYNEDPRRDIDMASYSLVKSYADAHGATYPDMLWEPKASFGAVAEHYRQPELA